jgi:hypothetical protein
MLELLLYVGTVLLVVVALLLIKATYRFYKETKAERQKIEWAEAQLLRALLQIQSDDEDTVLVGLQTIYALSQMGLPLEALALLADLLENRNPIIKQYAHVTIKSLSSSTAEFSSSDRPIDYDFPTS